ncbi:hypothetical protein HYFRA_00000648 [Hymenoscyphus fraxineus]|uniref:Required for respiratory growth protein 9, mitochondrial n=1 Tax=Hymenoscyphus fraxineus TaxID=746836 RepID=A0A9N9L526_9HELO|nr:hypothetical protein HYFRA_00000648 [Hymenoscyphus fraxineus]
MPCPCTINSLRFFVRAVAHVDIPATPSSVSRFILQRPQAAIPSLPSHRAPIQCRFKSTESTSASAVEDVDSIPESNRSFKSREMDKILSATTVATFSPEAIDAILEESKSAPPVISEVPVIDRSALIPLNSRNSQPREAKYEQRQGEKEFAPASREAKEPNQEFALRYSSPRAPVPTKSTSRSTRETRTPAGDDRKPVNNWVHKEPWQIQKAALKEKFPDGWNPLKRLSPDAMVGIRALHAQMPEKFTTQFLANHFEISAEGIRRILKSKWVPTPEVQTKREVRWHRRGESVWSRMAELGVKPPRVWRDAGIGRGKPEWMKERPKPALLMYPRREGGNFGENLNEPPQRSHVDEMPELITTRRPGPGEDFGESLNNPLQENYTDEMPELITTRRPGPGEDFGESPNNPLQENYTDEMPELITTRRPGPGPGEH